MSAPRKYDSPLASWFTNTHNAGLLLAIEILLKGHRPIPSEQIRLAPGHIGILQNMPYAAFAPRLASGHFCALLHSRDGPCQHNRGADSRRLVPPSDAGAEPDELVQEDALEGHRLRSRCGGLPSDAGLDAAIDLGFRGGFTYRCDPSNDLQDARVQIAPAGGGFGKLFCERYTDHHGIVLCPELEADMDIEVVSTRRTWSNAMSAGLWTRGKSNADRGSMHRAL